MQIICLSYKKNIKSFVSFFRSKDILKNVVKTVTSLTLYFKNILTYSKAIINVLTELLK